MFNFFHQFTSNAWEWSPEDEVKDYMRYKAVFLADYEVTCYAMVAENSDHLCSNGHYGVSWIEAEYEYKPPYSMEDLQNIERGIEKAEDNLLLIGIPFRPDYEFHGKNAANKKRKNDALRRRYNLDKLEKER